MTELNDALARFYGYPVFIVNEGWGGYTAADYLTLMSSAEWTARQTTLHPGRWLIHLGVNDARTGRSASQFMGDIQAIIGDIETHYGGASADIVLARPSYNTAYPLTPSYLPVVDALVANTLHAARGPDFWTYYGNHPDLYSSDGVHPNAAGVVQMARLWGLALMYPLNFSVSPGAGAATLSWSSLSSVEPSIAGYRVLYGTSPGTYTSVVDAGNTTSCSISGLSSSLTYYFTVVAYDNDQYRPNVSRAAGEMSVRVAPASVPARRRATRHG